MSYKHSLVANEKAGGAHKEVLMNSRNEAHLQDIG